MVDPMEMIFNRHWPSKRGSEQSPMYLLPGNTWVVTMMFTTPFEGALCSKCCSNGRDNHDQHTKGNAAFYSSYHYATNTDPTRGCCYAFFSKLCSNRLESKIVSKAPLASHVMVD
mmetsp:Transcript_28012/g.65470  ORF Transcript_28012/g.65470 Transcript_28012/m.65470 type:complete len:115 (+) Transcript_28012:265-609(+)